MIAALLVLVLAAIILVTRGRIITAVPFGAAAAVAMRLPHSDVLIGVVAFSLFVLVARWVIRDRLDLASGLLTIYAGMLTIELARAEHDFSSFGHVALRTGGDDWLAYESQAHTVLAGSLRGGEGVFVYSPAFRYMLALGHAMFGNGDGRVTLAVLAAITTSLLSFALIVVARARWHLLPGQKMLGASPRRLLVVAPMLLAVLAGTLLVTSAAVVSITRDPLSEPPTWILITIACTLLLLVRERWAFVTAAGVCALALVTRNDQGIGLLTLIAYGAVALLRYRRNRQQSLKPLLSTSVAAVAVFAVIALLPAAHNLYFANRLQLVVNSVNIPQNFPLSHPDVPHPCCNGAAQSRLVRQLRLLLVLGGGQNKAFVATIRLIQALWLGALLLAVFRWKRLDLLTHLISILPAAFLLPHLFLDLANYYPRHIIVGYLMMSLSAMYVFGRYASLNAQPAAHTQPRSPARG